MKKLFLMMGLAAISAIGFGQTVDTPDIYETATQSLSISELSSDGSYCTIWFGHQNPDYSYIVDIVSFTLDNKQRAIFLMEECLRVLDMNESGDIRHKVDNISMVRYSFAPKKIFLGSGLVISKRSATEIIEALNTYSHYKCEENKS